MSAVDLQLIPDELHLLRSLVDFALERYDGKDSPFTAGYVQRLKDLKAKLEAAE